MNEVITTATIGFISTIVGYIAGNRKTKAEANRLEIENVKEVISVYTMAINDLKAEVKELKTQLEKYQSHIEKLESELYSFRSQMSPELKRNAL
jgi:predicted RNase H-like nuclease (RuvC/YqgF family)